MSNTQSGDEADAFTYGEYLMLNRVLGAQSPRTADPNEMLFIIQHQTSELWMKLAVHELALARDAIRLSELARAFKTLARVSRIMEQLVQAWSVLATLTPTEYSQLRTGLGTSSGFQSYQYRMIEFMLGNKNAETVSIHKDHPESLDAVERALQEPSLYDETLALLDRTGFGIDSDLLERDVSTRHVANASVEEAWLQIYRQPQKYWALYELAEELVDLEDAFRQWRFRHVTTVERIIGLKHGTGGTAGVSYLRRQLDVVLFPELWSIRTVL